MDRELVFGVLALLLAGPMLLACGCWPASRDSLGASGRMLERARWYRIWLPLVPAATALALLVGWALMEPAQSDEPLPLWLFLVGAPFALPGLRALIRAMWSLTRTAADEPAAAVGLLRPRAVLSSSLAAALDAEAFAAAHEHEQAHVRHYDPLRIWLAQLASDLQWPGNAARTRFRAWRQALEFARDEEVRLGGFDGADLAAAVLCAAQLRRDAHTGAHACIAGDPAGLRERLGRLLAPLPETQDGLEISSIAGPSLILVHLATAGWLGLKFGDRVLNRLVGLLS